MAGGVIGCVRAEQVAAAVVTYNRADVLKESLQAVLGQTTPPGVVIVVDNASTDGTAELVRRDFPDAILVSMNDNTGAAGGFAEALRVGAELGYAWTWTFNDDDVPDREALSTLLGAIADMPTRTGVLGCARRDGSGRHYTLGGNWSNRIRSIPFVEPDAAPVAVDVLAFSGSLVSTAVVRGVGLPRADFFMMMEELEYCLRVRRAGWAVLVVPLPLVTAMAMGSGASSPPWRGYYQTRNHLLMALERGSAIEVWWWAVRTFKFMAADLASGSDGPRRSAARLKGAWHGARGVAGRTVVPGTPAAGQGSPHHTPTAHVSASDLHGEPRERA